MQKVLWTPSEEVKCGCRMADFMRFVNRNLGTAFHEYKELYQWSVTDIPAFWDQLWHYFDVIASKPYDAVVNDLGRFPGAKSSAANLSLSLRITLRLREARVYHCSLNLSESR